MNQANLGDGLFSHLGQPVSAPLIRVGSDIPCGIDSGPVVSRSGRTKAYGGEILGRPSFGSFIG